MSFKNLTTKSFPILFALDWNMLQKIAAQSDNIVSENDFFHNTSKLFNGTLSTENWQRSFILHLRNFFKHVCENASLLDSINFTYAIHISKNKEKAETEMLLFSLKEENPIERSIILKHFINECAFNYYYPLSQTLSGNIRKLLKVMNIVNIKEEKRINELEMMQRGYGNKIFVPYHYLCNTSPTFKELYELYPIEFMELFNDFLEESASGTHYKLSRNLLFAEQSEMFYLSNEKFQFDLLNHLQVRQFQNIRCKALSRFLDYCQLQQKSIRAGQQRNGIT